MVTASLIWATEGIVIRQVDLPAVVIAAGRMLFLALAGLGVALLAPRLILLRPRGYERRLIVLGILTALNGWLFILAIQLTDIGIAVVVTFTWPLWLVLFYAVLRIQRPSRLALAMLFVSLFGLILLMTRPAEIVSTRDTLGIGAALLVAITVALMLMITRSSPIDLPSPTIHFWQSGIACALLLPFAFASLPATELGLADVGLLAVLGIAISGFGGALFLTGVRRLSSEESGVLSYTEPVAATLIAMAVLGEVPGTRGALGMSLVVMAGIWTIAGERGAQRAGAEACGDTG